MRRHYIHNVILCPPKTGALQQDNGQKDAILLHDGKIVALGADVPPPTEDAGNQAGDNSELKITDGNGHYLTSGLVDMRAKLCSPGAEHKESIESGIRAAMKGGITTMVTIPCHDAMIDDVAGIEFIARRGREQKGSKLYCYAALTRAMKGEEITEMGLLSEAGALGFTDGELALENPLMMYRALTYAKGVDALVIQHPEMATLNPGGQMNQGALATLLGLKGMPNIAEVMMVERDIRLLEETGGRYHVAHISTRETVDVIRKAKARGLNITCDTAPQYFLLNELAVHDYRTFAKVNPPLRSEDDRVAIIEGLQDGTIDCIASDHVPQDQDSKRQPFEWAEFGMVGLETLFALSLKLVHDGQLSLCELLQKLTTNPAKILRLPSNELKVGEAADLMLFDKDIAWQIREEELISKSKNTSFDKMPVQGKVLKCWIDGRVMNVGASR
ncbi:MAG: dihydroorotase [Alphaproteobacteria bacterium]|nr:dihydroorotase [Alphaproteobacteria bacterium]